MEIKLDFSLVLAVLLGELLFGVLYNFLIGWAERRRYLEGYTSLAVALGVVVTVGLTAFFSWAYALLVLGSFCASGLPMVLGSVWRHVKIREMEQNVMRHWKGPEPVEFHYKTEPHLYKPPTPDEEKQFNFREES